MDTQDTFTDAQPAKEAASRPDFSIREFLAQREALLVHFSTPMSNHREIYFPLDLRIAAKLRGKALFFSTIQAGDVGPHQDPNMDSIDANAGGSIGLIVDIASNDCVTAVGPSDGGGSRIRSPARPGRQVCCRPPRAVPTASTAERLVTSG